MPLGLPLLLGAGLLAGWVLLVLFTCWLLTHPPRRTYAHAVARNLPGDPSELAIPSGDGSPARPLRFSQWTFRSRGADLPVWDIQGLNPAGPTIILSHGWGDSRVVMLPRIAALAPLASRIIAWDMPAHGDAPRGRFTLGAAESADLLELFDRVALAPDRPGARILLYGFSLGAAVTVDAASQLSSRSAPTSAPLAGLILEAPYRIPATPARNVLRVRAMPYRSNLGAAMLLLTLRFGHRFRSSVFDRARHLFGAPALILHGTLDAICPEDDSREIAARNPCCTLQTIPNALHNSMWTDPVSAPLALAAVRQFISSVVDGRVEAIAAPAAQVAVP